MELKGKTAVITGGGAGIGEGISLCLAGEGADIAIIDISKEGATRVANKIEMLGRKSLGLVADVTDSKQIQQAIQKIVDALEKIDILVNNVGGEVRFYKDLTGERFAEISEQEWDDMIDLNLKATISTCKVVVPYMLKRNSGKIVNIASTGGRRPIWTGARLPASIMAYNVSKAGIIQFTDLLALELAEYNINVNCVAPGGVWTPMFEKHILRTIAADSQFRGLTPREYFEKVTVPSVPLKREITPADIGNAVAFFVSEKARNITGQSINVDAGSQPN
jgi:NAD(P)-dependent dehydrogenase (short-subunit alcohol dehydrogenase family)